MFESWEQDFNRAGKFCCHCFARRGFISAGGGVLPQKESFRFFFVVELMLVRKPIFPGIIEFNYQLGRVIGCNVYLIFDGNDWMMIDIGYEEVVDEVVETIRQLDFPFSSCTGLIATHADVDHIQGLSKLKSLLKAPVLAHKLAAKPLQKGDPILTFAKIEAQKIDLDMPPVTVDRKLKTAKY